MSARSIVTARAKAVALGGVGTRPRPQVGGPGPGASVLLGVFLVTGIAGGRRPRTDRGNPAETAAAGLSLWGETAGTQYRRRVSSAMPAVQWHFDR